MIENSTSTTTSSYETISCQAGDMEIRDSNINSLTNTINYGSSGILKITGETNIESTSTSINNGGTGRVEITGEVSIIGGAYGIRNWSTGSITIGENDGNISITYPSIIGNEYGIYNGNSNGTLNFYDGIIKGKTGTIFGNIFELATSCQISKSKNGDYYEDILVLTGAEVSVARIGTVTYTSLQSAIASCTDGSNTTIVLERDVTLSEKITINSGQDINISLSGCIITYNGTTITNANKSTAFTIESGATLTITN